MRSFIRLFEKVKEAFTQAEDKAWNTAEDFLADELKHLAADMKWEYMVDYDVRSGDAAHRVLDWIRDNDPELFQLAMRDPVELRNHDSVDNALADLRKIKSWDDVDPHVDSMDDQQQEVWDEIQRQR